MQLNGSKERPFRILTADLITRDIIIPEEGNKEIVALKSSYGLMEGGKSPLEEHQFDEFNKVVKNTEDRKDKKFTVEPGGSSANTLVTLIKLLGTDNVNAKYLTMAGSDDHTKEVIRSLGKVNITLLPPQSKYDAGAVQSATSFVLMNNGQRTIATHQGNARDKISSDIITDDMVKNSDAIFVQGSLWEKFDKSFPDRLLTLRWLYNKELWLTLPTHEEFARNNAKRFKELVCSANVVLGNAQELANIYKQGSLAMDLQELQKGLIEAQKVFKDENQHFSRNPVALITNDKEPAYVVTTDSISQVGVKPVEDKDVVNKLGAGDTTFAGFLAGHIKRLKPEESAEVAMALGREKVLSPGARLEDPKQALRNTADSGHILKDIAAAIFSPIRELAGVGGRY